MGHKSFLVATNDDWQHNVLYTVADYSSMATRIQVFTELRVCGQLTVELLPSVG